MDRGDDGPAGSDALRLAELLAARLCHELSGPAGTLAGAVEIARAEPESAAEALGLAAEAASALTARLRLLRAACANGVDDLDRARLAALCTGLPRLVRVEFGALSPILPVPQRTARVLLNVLLLAAESLPKGGAVTLGEAGQDTAVILLGEGAAWPAGLTAWMADPLAAWRAIAAATPRGLQGPLTALLAHEGGIRLSFAFAAGAEAAPPLLVRFR